MTERHAEPTRLRICRVGIPLADVAADREGLIRAAFALAEIEWAEQVPARTLAGRLAAKRALNDLAGRGDHDLCAWGIAAEPDGAPRVVRVPQGCDGDWRVSISHSRTTAWGLATLGELKDRR